MSTAVRPCQCWCARKAHAHAAVAAAADSPLRMVSASPTETAVGRESAAAPDANGTAGGVLDRRRDDQDARRRCRGDEPQPPRIVSHLDPST